MLRDDVDRITTWLQSRLPDHDVAVGEQADAVAFKIFNGDASAPSSLRVPEEYLTSIELGVDRILDVLERADFPDMVESEEGICRVVSRSAMGGEDELVLADC